MSEGARHTMPAMPRYRFVLAKEDFKFSAAHFTLFADAGGELDGAGLLLDIESFKRELRRLCARLDSRTLIPGESPRLRWTRQGDAIDVQCGERIYRFPAEDTLLLPLANTSIELLARMLWQDLAPHLAGSRVESMSVSVEESPGQRCWYEENLTPASPAPSSSPAVPAADR